MIQHKSINLPLYLKKANEEEISNSQLEVLSILALSVLYSGFPWLLLVLFHQQSKGSDRIYKSLEYHIESILFS